MPAAAVGPFRAAEERHRASLVGVQTVEFRGCKDGVIAYGRPIRRDIARALGRHRPAILVTLHQQLTWGQSALNMAAHRWVALATLDAAQDAGHRWILPALLAEGWEPWPGGSMVGLSGSPAPTHAVEGTACLAQGMASRQQHRGYLANLSAPCDLEAFLRPQADETGPRCGGQCAVRVEVIGM